MVQMGIDMTPLKKGVFTIGYGDLEPKKFFEKIAAADLTILIDVRSSPNTERFNKRMMEIRVGSKYKSIPRLGGKEYSPLQYEAWKENAKKDLEWIARMSKNGAIGLMCAEGEAHRCHRTYFISKALKELYGIVAIHL